MQLELRKPRSLHSKKRGKPRPRASTLTTIWGGRKPKPITPIIAGPSKIPKNYGVQPMAHRQYQGMYCCRISVALEGSYFIVDAAGIVDCFPTYEEAFSAGSRALFTIINKRIVLPKKSDPKAPEIVASLRRDDDPEIIMGFFGGYD